MKAALHGWVYDLARDLGAHGGTANVIAPGFVPDTEFWEARLTEQMRRDRVRAEPRRSPGRAGRSRVADRLAAGARGRVDHRSDSVAQRRRGARAVSRAVVWFRRDLRLADHPALVHALDSADEVLPLVVLDPVLLCRPAPPRRGPLPGLRRRTARLHGRSAAGPPRDTSQGRTDVAAEVGAGTVHVSGESTPYGRRRDEQAAQQLADRGIELVQTGTPYAVAPGRVQTGVGTGYQVFTPFYRAWRSAAGASRHLHHVGRAGSAASDPRSCPPSIRSSPLRARQSPAGPGVGSSTTSWATTTSNATGRISQRPAASRFR